MKQFFQALPYVVVGVFVGLFGFLLGRYVFPDDSRAEERVSSNTLVKEVTAQGFLVTQTIVAEQKVSYTVDNGSDWSNFWWGHEVTARATMQTTYGVDLGKLKESDIYVNDANKTVCFAYPANEIKSIALAGEIEVATKSGIFKKLFSSDTNGDYNRAFELLRNEAQRSVGLIESLPKDSYAQADKTLSLLLVKTGYEVASDCRR